MGTIMIARESPIGKNNEADAKKVAGSLTEAIGKVTGDAEMQEAGKSQKEAGQIESELPTVKATRARST